MKQQSCEGRQSGGIAGLVTAAYILTGLRVSREEPMDLYRGLQTMRESTGYQAILDEGRVLALQRTLLRQGRIRFGPPSEAIEAALQGILDGDRLERMTERLLTASNWQELLQTA